MTIHVSPTRRQFFGSALAAIGAGLGLSAVTKGGSLNAQGVFSSIESSASASAPATRVRLETALTFPVAPGAGLLVLNNFGGRSVSTGTCSHRGIDIFPTGDAEPRLLVACVDGVIGGQRFAGSSGSQGNAWILKDAFGVSYRYHHIDEFEPGLEVGSIVRRGDPIATMGSSGNANSDHLHFEVRLDGTGVSAVDPIPRFVFPIDDVVVGAPTGCT